MTRRHCCIQERLSYIILQQVLAADDSHGRAGADQRAEHKLSRVDHDTFLMSNVRVISVSASQQGVYGQLSQALHTMLLMAMKQPAYYRFELIQHLADQSFPFTGSYEFLLVSSIDNTPSEHLLVRKSGKNSIST